MKGRQYLARTWWLFISILIFSLVLMHLLGTRSDPDHSANQPPTTEEPSVRYTDQLARAIDFVYTTNKEVALTFNGMADLDTMRRLIQVLDKHEIKATFFVPGMRVAEEPDIAGMIIEAGHELQSNTLDQMELSELTYEQIYENLRLTSEIIERETKLQPRYVRTKSGDYTDDIRKAVHALGMEAVIGNSINPRDREKISAQEIGAYVDRFLHRGAIIQLNTHLNPEIVEAISLIADAVEGKGYRFVLLDQMIHSGGERRPLEEIPGYDAATINPDVTDVAYWMVDRLPAGKAQVALTFDDWGSESTVNGILDILEVYDVKSTFFVNGIGVEHNPNLASAIIADGHEIANHTYSHQVVTDLTATELQEEIVKAHRAITEAIQQQPVMMFRPPTGTITDREARIIAATGYKIIALYDVTTLDWDVANSAEDIVSRVLDRTEDGSIILLHLHDGIHTTEALPVIIEQLRSRGLEFVKMSELLGLNN